MFSCLVSLDVNKFCQMLEEKKDNIIHSICEQMHAELREADTLECNTFQSRVSRHKRQEVT